MRLCSRLHRLARLPHEQPLLASFPCRSTSALSATVTIAPLLPCALFAASFGSARLRPPPSSQPLPEAGTFNSRRARRAAQFGNPTTPRAGGSREDKQKLRAEEREKEDAKKRSYDKAWAPVSRTKRRPAAQPSTAPSRAAPHAGPTRASEPRIAPARRAEGRGRVEAESTRDAGFRTSPVRRDNGRRRADVDEDEDESERAERRPQRQRAARQQPQRPVRVEKETQGGRQRGPPSELEGIDEDDYEVKEDDEQDVDDDAMYEQPQRPSQRTRQPSSTVRPRRAQLRPARPTPPAASALPSSSPAAPPAGAAASGVAKAPSTPIPATLSGSPLVVDGYSFCFVRPPVVTPHLLQLAALTSIPILPYPPPSDFSLQYGSNGRSLALRHGSNALPLIVHWHSNITAVHRTPLIRALAHGLPHSTKEADQPWADQPLRGLTVVDATAGKGRDAFHIACAGADVHACERHPALYALLSHAHQRILADDGAVKLRPRVQRIHPLYADALILLPTLPTAAVPLPDLVYIDTASAEHGLTSSLEGKQRGRIERVLSVRGKKGDAQEGEERRTRGERLEEAAREEQRLLEVARRVAKRVVVKRPVPSSPDKEAASEEGLLASFRSSSYLYAVFAGTEGDSRPIVQPDDRADPVVDQEMQMAESSRDS